MKKLVLFCALAAMLAACDDPENKDNKNGKDSVENPGGNDTAEGTIMIGTNSVSLTHGAMIYFGQYESDEGANIDLVVANAKETSGLYIEMYAPDTAEELVAGTYTFDAESHQPFTIDAGNAVLNDNGNDITGGTVIVAKSGETYTITFNLTSVAGDVSGNFKGELPWEDGRDTRASKR